MQEEDAGGGEGDAIGAADGLSRAQPVVPLEHSPRSFPSIIPEWQEQGDGEVAVAANSATSATLSARHVEESKVRQTAAEQVVEQGSKVESRDVVHETTSKGKRTLLGSSALLSPNRPPQVMNRPPQVMGQASANVLPLPGACAAGIQDHATAHVGTAGGAGGVAPAYAAAGRQDAKGDKNIDSHAVKADGSKREERPSDARKEEEDCTLKEEANQVSTSRDHESEASMSTFRDHESEASMSSPFASCSIGFSLIGGAEQPDNSGFAEHMGLSALELENRFMEEGITRLRARGREGAFVVTAETGFLETSLVSMWV